MHDLASLTTMLADAERRRDEALAAETDARRLHDAARRQADELVAYRVAYERRWSDAFCREGAIELVRCYQGFVDRLTQAVDHQTRAALHAESRLATATLELRDLEVRAAALRKLLGRRAAELVRAAERREQHQSDETSARVAWQRQVTITQPTIA